MKRLIAVLILLFPFYLKAQDLTKDKHFFEEKLEDTKEWLSSSKLDLVIKINKVEVSSEKVIVKMNIPDYSNWNNLDEKIKEENENKIGLSETIFKKIVFQMDLENEQLEIEFEGADILIVVTYFDNAIQTEKMQKMGIISDKIEVPINDVKLDKRTYKNVSKDSITVIKSMLKKGLQEYLKENETYFEDYKFDIILDIRSQLVLEISNISKVIITDESYFEHIRLDFQFNKEEDKISITYDIKAKYAAGIIWAPRESRYKDVDPKYSESFKKFSDKLKNQINQILTNAN